METPEPRIGGLFFISVPILDFLFYLYKRNIMRTIEINGVKHKLPTTWMDIHLEQFQRLKEVEDNIDQADFYDYTLNQIEAITGLSQEFLENLTPEQIGNVSTIIAEIISTPAPQIKDAYCIINNEPFIFDGATWQMWISEFAALDMFSQDNDKLWENAAKIAACVWRSPKKLSWIDKTLLKKGFPINFGKLVPEDFQAAKMQINAEYFYKEMPMPYIYTAVVFFCLLREKYRKFTDLSLKRKQVRTQKSELQKKMGMPGSPTKNDGTGTRPSVFSRKKT